MMKTRFASWTAALAIIVPTARAAAESLVIEAEQFATKGGWQIDTQFIETMGSPYLIAHGLGKPVADASTEVEIAEAGSYQVWVRTMDWSESLGRAGGAGRFTMNIGGKEIAAAKLLEVETGALKKITGNLFADCTGHGFIGQWAGADLTMTEKGRMGMSNMWMWKSEEEPQPFREEPWMLSLDEKGFPYPKRGHAEWFWESGYDSHPVKELEQTRDWNLLASFSAWNAIKNHSAYTAHDPQKKGHAHARLDWMAYIGGTREALGTIRVMKTIGMMGVAIGRAAAICKARDCQPRDVYEKHLEEVKHLWRMPGAKRFKSVEDLRKDLDTAVR